MDMLHWPKHTICSVPTWTWFYFWEIEILQGSILRILRSLGSLAFSELVFFLNTRKYGQTTHSKGNDIDLIVQYN